MSIEQKSPELTQAQIAAHTHKTPEVAMTANDVAAAGISELAAGPLVAYSSTTMSGDPVFSEEAFTQVPTTTEHTPTAVGVADYIGEQGSTNNPVMQFRYKALQAYTEFAPDMALQVPNLREYIAKASEEGDFRKVTEALAEHESHIGSGDQGVAFGFTHNGKEYVAKMSREAGGAAKAVDGDLLGLICGEGMPHMQQVAAISYVDGIIVTERLPGKDLEKLDPEVLSGATKEQLRDALITMHAAFERGIRFDPKPSNYVYDPKDGFGFIDYASRNSPEVGELANDDEMAEEFGQVLLHRGYKELQVKEDYVEAAKIKAMQLPVLRNYYDACVELVDSRGYDYSVALPKLYAQVVELQTFVEDCGRTGWIENDIERQAQEKRMYMQRQAELRAQEEAMRARGENPDFF